MALALVPLIMFGIIFGIGYVGISLVTSHAPSNVIEYSSFNRSASTNSDITLGLQLSLSINSTHITPDESLGINISEFNLLSTINNATASNNWAIQGLRLGPCGSSFPFGMALFQGYYGSANITSGSPLYLYNPMGIYLCPAFFSNYYVFEPSSDIATIEILGSAVPVSYSTGIGSYWDSSGNEHSLAVGVYTIVAGDEWGQLVILHFAVVSESNLNGPTVGSVAFSNAWHYAGNVTVNGTFTPACVLLTPGCIPNSNGSAIELVSSDGRVAYVENARVNNSLQTIVLINDSLYCVNPRDNILSQPACPAIIE